MKTLALVLCACGGIATLSPAQTVTNAPSPLNPTGTLSLGNADTFAPPSFSTSTSLAQATPRNSGSLLLAQASTPAATPPAPAPAAKVDASAAIEKRDPTGKFQWMHLSFLARAKQPMDVLFLGDSITEGWVRAPHVWDHFYGMYRPANFGIGGDQTQHVIWRIENGELDSAKPKVVVLMLGTNNTSPNANTADEIFAADKKIVDLIHARIPTTKVLLVAIFPRGARRNAQGVVTPEAVAEAKYRMSVINAVNAQLAKLDDGQTVRYLDVGDKFLGQDGLIPWQIMPDQLHPTPAGYQLWAETMQPLLEEMLAAPGKGEVSGAK